MNKYIVIPSCSDLNRGDQALTWETVRIAKTAGFDGEYYMLRSGNEPINQSEEEGIKAVDPILLHPSRKFKSSENVAYNISLLLSWGAIAFSDFITSMLFLNKLTRKYAAVLLTGNQRNTQRLSADVNGIFVKGGGFLHSSGKITDLYKTYYFLFHLMLAQTLGKPVYVMPNSYGPFRGLGISWLVRKVLKRCKVVTVRESISKRMLSEIGIDAQLYPDLGFGLSLNNRPNTELQELRASYPNRKLVAITARPYRFPASEEPIKKYQ